MEEFSELMISGIAPYFYPTTVYFGIIWCGEDNCIELPLRYPFKGEWGEILSYDNSNNSTKITPDKVQIAWTSICEKQSYYIEEKFDSTLLAELLNKGNGEKKLYSHIVIGMAPFGGLALWVRGEKKGRLFKWMKAARIDIPMRLLVDSPNDITMDEYCDAYLSYDPEVSSNLINNGLPDGSFYDRLMDQYNYRFRILFQQWKGDSWVLPPSETNDIPSVDSIIIKRYDGSFDKTGKYDYESNDMYGKPQFINIKWHLFKAEISAYIWMEYDDITKIFIKLFGAHRDTKTDFIIRVDTDKNKYELSLYRQGLKEPIIIPESAYQMILFKNKFEHFRSENYNQPRGGWIW